MSYQVNLPEISPLLNGSSTYISFTKALYDFDRAENLGTPYYFSKMVALNLPDYKYPDFFLDLTPIDITETNPNTVIPKGIQNYMENILRQDIDNPHITEIAFWKFLNKCGIQYSDIQKTPTFINGINISNFIEVGNNNGWCEIVCQIPNKCSKLNIAYKTINEIPNIIQSENIGGLFDNGDKQFIFNGTNMKDVIDFENLIYIDGVDNQFDFNCFLIFYRDSDGVDKLHGINFINNFDNKITYFDMPKFTQKTNDSRSIGYQFKLNLKTVNNTATKLLIYELQEHSHWNVFGETLGKLNSFLEIEMREKNENKSALNFFSKMKI